MSQQDVLEPRAVEITSESDQEVCEPLTTELASHQELNQPEDAEDNSPIDFDLYSTLIDLIQESEILTLNKCESPLDKGTYTIQEFELPVIDCLDMTNGCSENLIIPSNSNSSNQIDTMIVPSVSTNCKIINDEQGNGNGADMNVSETIIALVSNKTSSVAPKTRKSLKSRAKVITSEENIKEVRE